MAEQTEVFVFKTQKELDDAVAAARKDGAKPRQTRRFVVNGHYVMAHGIDHALGRALKAEVAGIQCEELGDPPTLEAVLQDASRLTESQKAALLKALGKGGRPSST